MGKFEIYINNAVSYVSDGAQFFSEFFNLLPSTIRELFTVIFFLVVGFGVVMTIINILR